MNAKKIKKILMDNGFSCWIASKVEYTADGKKSYSVVRMMPYRVTCHLIYILYELDCIAVVTNVEKIKNNIVTTSMYVEIYPKDMASFDWDE